MRYVKFVCVCVLFLFADVFTGDYVGGVGGGGGGGLIWRGELFSRVTSMFSAQRIGKSGAARWTYKEQSSIFQVRSLGLFNAELSPEKYFAWKPSEWFLHSDGQRREPF